MISSLLPCRRSIKGLVQSSETLNDLFNFCFGVLSPCLNTVTFDFKIQEPLIGCSSSDAVDDREEIEPPRESGRRGPEVLQNFPRISAHLSVKKRCGRNEKVSKNICQESFRFIDLLTSDHFRWSYLYLRNSP